MERDAELAELLPCMSAARFQGAGSPASNKKQALAKPPPAPAPVEVLAFPPDPILTLNIPYPHDANKALCAVAKSCLHGNGWGAWQTTQDRLQRDTWHAFWHAFSDSHYTKSNSGDSERCMVEPRNAVANHAETMINSFIGLLAFTVKEPTEKAPEICGAVRRSRATSSDGSCCGLLSSPASGQYR